MEKGGDRFVAPAPGAESVRIAEGDNLAACERSTSSRVLSRRRATRPEALTRGGTRRTHRVECRRKPGLARTPDNCGRGSRLTNGFLLATKWGRGPILPRPRYGRTADPDLSRKWPKEFPTGKHVACRSNSGPLGQAAPDLREQATRDGLCQYVRWATVVFVDKQLDSRLSAAHGKVQE